MIWIVLAILPFFFWSIVNILDKIVVSHKVDSPTFFWVCQVFLASIILLIIPFTDFYVLDPMMMVWVAVAGSLYFFAAVPYYQAVKIEEISRINILWNLAPVFVLILSFIFLKERLELYQYISFVFLVVGALVASIHSRLSKLSLSKGLLLMIFATFFYAISFVALDYVTLTNSFVVVYLWTIIFMILSSFTLFVSRKFRKDFKLHFSRLDKSLVAFIFAVAIFDHLGVFFAVWAIDKASSALVTAMEGFQTIFVFIIATIISIFLPKIFREEIDKKNITLKFMAILFMFVGIMFLALSG